MDSRLELITTMVPPNSIVADIGTDHGHLIVELVGKGLAKSGYACDINKMPLEKARRAIKNAGLEDKITAVQCDGLTGMDGKDINCFVIAGMGGELISAILERSPLKGQKDITYILQPMTKPERLREYLYANGYEIIQEGCATEGRFTYCVMKTQYTGNTTLPDPIDLYLGAIGDLNTPHKLLYAKKVYNRIHTKLNGLKRSGVDSPELATVAAQINKKIKDWS